MKAAERADVRAVHKAQAQADADSTVRRIRLLVSSLRDKGLRVAILAAIQARALLATR
jgi:hypothetical protein